VADEDLPTCYRHPDRPTGLSCSECGRPICVDCMTVAPVGLRCPEHAGGRRQSHSLGKHVVVRAPSTPLAGTTALVTKTLIAANIAIYLVTVVQGGGLNSPGGSLLDKMILIGHAPPGFSQQGTVAGGDWWRLITSAFLHANLVHIGFNMLALWWFGGPVEEYLGRVRFILLYVVAGLAGAAGALLQAPTAPTLGASGAIFGILGAMLILEWQATGRLGGNAMTLIVINLAISFVYSGISWGGHVGGLVGGILGTLAFARFGRGHAAYGRLGAIGVAGLVLIGVASVAIAYWKVKGYA
jgi:membrane associated rhomboid family serine protease